MTEEQGPEGGEERPVQAGQFEMGWGSDVVAQMLRDFGIDYITLNPGASYRGLHDSLVNYLGNRDPQMLILGATGPVDAAQRRPWIEWIHTAKNQGALIRDYVKWDDQPGSPEAAVESMLRAWQITRTAPNGPVYVCLDLGMQEQALDAPLAIPDTARYVPGGDPAPAPADLAKAAVLLENAERPLILAGKASRDTQGWEDRIRLAERLDARVLTDLKAGAAFPTDHPLHPLPPIKRPSKTASAMLAEADVILALEWIDPAGTFQQATGATETAGTLIQCTVDPYLHNGWSMDHQILPAADLRLLCRPESLVPALLDALGDGTKTSGWGDIAAEPPEAGPDGVLDYQDISDALAAALDGRPATLTGVPLGWPGYAWPFAEPLDFLGGDGGAGIGSGPGIAVGAALALQGSGRIPVAVLGDGDTTMGINALWTAAKYRIPLLIIVANNRSYFNDELHQERIARTRGRPEENRWIGQRLEYPVPDIAGIARGFGWQATGAVATRDDLFPALADAVATVAEGGRALVDTHIMRGYDLTVVNPGGIDKDG